MRPSSPIFSFKEGCAVKQNLLAALALLCLLAAAACGSVSAPAGDNLLVILEETSGCTVECNGQAVPVGGDAAFTLRLEPGWSLTGTDYAGTYDIDVSGRTATLTLRSVQYPARVRLQLANRYCTITYDANGGSRVGDGPLQESRSYDLTFHLRPNTSTGVDLFTREGYTLTGWNTRSDGSGEAVGLGSRVTVSDGAITLYAQWAKWSDPADFTWSQNPEGMTVTGYHGADSTVVIPARVDGTPVTAVADGAFDGCSAEAVVFPPSMRDIAPGAFQDCALERATLFDSIRTVSDSSFTRCPDLKTLYINAVEAPFGYTWRKESCYADKVDRLILTQDKKQAVFYGGCSVWYNLDSLQAQKALEGYALVNLGLNGTVNSPVQLQILGHYLGEGDLVIHTLELSSRQQLLIHTAMGQQDDKLWCGLENNYDLFILVDLTTVEGVFDSLCHYLSLKSTRATYAQYYQDEEERSYLDPFGGIPFFRSGTEDNLSDLVYLDPSFLDDDDAMDRLAGYYDWFQSKGARVYVSCACVNLDAVPETQRENTPLLDRRLQEVVGQMEGAALISAQADYLYENNDFYDTNYHLVTQAAQENTARWLRDLQSQMELDGIREGEP